MFKITREVMNIIAALPKEAKSTGMTFPKANEYADKVNQSMNLKATVVRILSEEVDPIQDGDNGWDVEIEVTGEE